jgi:lambda family phage portal protein
MTSGEAFFQKIYVDPTEENPIPFRLKAIESDLLDHTYSVSKLTNGNRIVSGVELDENDRPVSYHFFAQHPGEDASIVQERVEIPADRIYHIFDAERPGQVRGYPQAAAAITRILGLSDYEGAELDRKKLSAMLFAFVTAQLPDAEGEHVFGGKNSSDGVFEADLEPGTAQYLEPGEDIKFNEPADVGGSYEAFMKMNLRAVAACFDVSYEQMTGDLTSVNFSSIRAGLNEMQRIYRQTQALVIIPQLCRRVWRDFAREAITNFLIPAPDFTTNPRGYLKAKWIAPGWPYVNPLQEAQANIAEVRAGLNSRENVVGSKGFDINELDTQIATDNDRADTLGLKFDSDARTTNKSGAVQPDVETNT